jgi:hypothetical protein
VVVVMASDGPSPPGARFVVKKHASTGFGRRKGRASPVAQDLRFRTVNSLVSVEVAADGIFSRSPISAGDICLSVDGVPAGGPAGKEVAARAMRRSQSIVALLMFSVLTFRKSVVELAVDAGYGRWWKSESVCVLLPGDDEEGAPITLTFKNDERKDAAEPLPSSCTAEGNEGNKVDVQRINTIIERVMGLLTESVRATMKNRSNVYRRALIKLEEKRENGALATTENDAGGQALAQGAILTAK